MADFSGGEGAAPGVYDEVVTNSTGVSVPGGTRNVIILGEGVRVERLVASAVGSGKDGRDPTYTTTTGSDGRHFKLSFVPIISNRTVLFKNGIPLVGHEEAITNGTPTFNGRYDYRLEISTGKIELQGASLVDQGGSFYSASTLNTGNGTISSLTLADVNAPTETWTVRCTSVRRDGYGNPIDGYAKFVAQGTVSGVVLDGYGNQVVWQSNGVVVTNTILSFAINEGLTNFREGDKFTIKVKGGALSRGDSLVANYIPVTDINDPEAFNSLDDVIVKHGSPSLTNRVSLGAQLAFANSPPAVWTCETAPSVPRRISYILRESASGNAGTDDLEFRLPLDVIPDFDSNINFFVTDPVTKEENQILPNKVDFYDAGFTTSPGSFLFGGAHSFSYTVILDPLYEEIAAADDGVIAPTDSTHATLSSLQYTFTLADAVASRKIRILTPNPNAGDYDVVSVSNGNVTIFKGGGFTSSTGVNFEVLDNTDSGAVVLFTHDLALAAGQTLRATVVDTKDSSFFDAGWTAALAAIESIEIDIVVPLPSQTISSIFATARAHCESMSTIKRRKERVLFIGAIQGLTPDNVAGTTPAAVEDIGILEGIQGDTTAEILAGNDEDLTDYNVQSSFGNSFRVVYFYPDQIVVQIGASNTFVDGFFIAAAAAGFLCGIPNVAVPLTNKTVAGFTILRDKLFRPSVVESLINGGITVLQPATGGGTVIWGRTTTNSGFPEEEELSIVFIRDRIAKSMRIAFQGFIGTAESPTLQGSLANRANSILQSFIAGGLITAFTNLKVARDKVDPRQWNITVQVQPVYPVNFIYIQIGLGII